MEAAGAHRAGVAKVIPPRGWKARRDYNNLRMDIPAPISQLVTGKQGLYQQFNIQQKDTSLKEFRVLANSERYCPPNESDFDELERKYWKNITFNPPLYGADIPGSLYDKDVKVWNLNHLNTILDDVKDQFGINILGVNTSYLYFGMWKSTFAWHTEDMDLYSINYIHFGAPKTWYAVPPEHGRRLERLASGFFPGSFQNCSAFLRHKMTIISPQILKRYSIPYDKIVHKAGEFMITFPYGYHCGFNQGFNCAESTNFATERWIDFGKRADLCECKKDSVKICMDIFVKKYQPEQWEEYIASKESDESDSESEEEIDVEEDEEDAEEEKKPGKKRLQSRPQKRGLQKTTEDVKEVVVKKARRQPISKKYSKTQTLKEQITQKTEKQSTGFEDKLSFLSGLWQDSPLNFELEKAYNKAASSDEDLCALCLLFTSTKVEFTPEKRKQSSSDPQQDLEGANEKQRPENVDNCLTEIPVQLEASETEESRTSIEETTETYMEINGSQASSVEENKLAVSSEVSAESSVAGNMKSKRLKTSVPLVSEICFSPSDADLDINAWPDEGISTGDGNSVLLTCQSCCLTVHASCYGVEGVSEHQQWTCDRCSQDDIEIITKTHCALCSLRGGALKQTQDQRWVHIGCAIAYLDVVFEDASRRSSIDISKISPARWKLSCVYCRPLSNQEGACVQCCAGKCAVAFHVNCSFHAGVPLHVGDWPRPVETFCQRHQRNKSKENSSRNISEMKVSQQVIAKHKNGRYYQSEVLERTSEETYCVQFEDGSFCENLPPTDIVEPSLYPGKILGQGEKVKIEWPEDGLIYDGKILDYNLVVTYQIEFEDGSVLSVRGEDVYGVDEELPKKVKTRLSLATETAKKMFVEEEVANSKRRRIDNRRFSEIYM